MTLTPRRPFLEGLAAFTAVPLGAKDSQRHHSPFERVVLGRTGIATTRLGFGTGVHSINRDSELLRRCGRSGAVQLLRAAYDRGIRYFDLADTYGSHPLAAEAFKGLPRDSYVLATKYWWSSGGIPASDRSDVATSVDRFLRELHTDYIDIVELHCVTSPQWPSDLAKHMEALAAAKKAGKIRAHGCSFHSCSALETAIANEWIDLAHVRLNPYGRNMTSHPDRVLAQARKFHTSGKGIIAMKVLGVGTLKDKPDGINRSLRWNLESGVADVLNIGFTSLAEIDDIIRRIEALG